jgi:hypothetical protein
MPVDAGHQSCPSARSKRPRSFKLAFLCFPAFLFIPSDREIRWTQTYSQAARPITCKYRTRESTTRRRPTLTVQQNVRLQEVVKSTPPPHHYHHIPTTRPNNRTIAKISNTATRSGGWKNSRESCSLEGDRANQTKRR